MNPLDTSSTESVVAVDFDDVLLPLVHPLIEYYNANHANGADFPCAEIANFKTYNYQQCFGIWVRSYIVVCARRSSICRRSSNSRFESGVCTADRSTQCSAVRSSVAIVVRARQ